MNHTKKIQRNSKLGRHLGNANKIASDKVNKTGERYPLQTIYFARDTAKGYSYHPTQKPVDLFVYLIKTYTNKYEIVLDNVMGSGTTAVACLKTNRKFIGFEWHPEEPHDKYYNKALKRIAEFNPEFYKELPKEERPNKIPKRLY